MLTVRKQSVYNGYMMKTKKGDYIMTTMKINLDNKTTILKRTIGSRYSGKGFIQSYTHAGTKISLVDTSKGEKWIPTSLLVEMSTIANASDGVCHETMTLKCKYTNKTALLVDLKKYDLLSTLEDGEHFIIGSNNAEFIRLTVKDGFYSYTSTDCMGQRKTVQNRTLKQMQRKKISWLVAFK